MISGPEPMTMLVEQSSRYTAGPGYEPVTAIRNGER
jgi:hypothetical protein